MRPILLSMTAFGPYREKEVIDFTELKEHRLFVISGNTGAGKTTIFDAICFGLYGTASGEDRSETRLLRSHFADESLHTSVELIFAVKDRTYRVYRQMKHRKGNNKSETGEKIELFEVTAEGEVPAVDRFIIRDVDTRLEEIIGLTKDQFSQIVMLPQGEFRKLLTSSTDNKEDILRKIFRTQQFDQLEKITGQQYKQLHDRLKTGIYSRDQLLIQVQEAVPLREESKLAEIFTDGLPNSHQVIEALGEELTYYEKNQHIIREKREQLAHQLTDARRKLSEAEQLDSNIRNLQLRKHELSLLEEQSFIQKQREQKIQLAERAKIIVPYEERLIRADRQLISSKDTLEARHREWEVAEGQALAANTIFNQEQKNEELRKITERSLNQLTDILPVVKQYELDRQSARETKIHSENYAGQLITCEQTIQQLKERKQEIQSTIESQDQIQLLSLTLDNELKEIEQKGKLLTRLIEYYNELSVLDEQLANQSILVEHGHEKYVEAEKRWLEGQAAVLAAHLHLGEHCPVCGSLEHPQKASSGVETPSREILKELQEAQRKLEQLMHSLHAQRTAKLELIEQQREQLINTEKPDTQKKVKVSSVTIEGSEQTKLVEQQGSLRQSWKMTKEKLDGVNQKLQVINELKQELAKLDQDLEKEEKKKMEWQNTIQQLQIKLATIESRIEQLEERVPIEMREFSILQEKLSQQQQLQKQLQLKWRMAQEEQQKSASQLASALARYEEAKLQMNGVQQEQQDSYKEYSAMLVEAGFSEAQQYIDAKLSSSEIDILKEQYENYKQQLERIKQAIEVLTQEVAGKAVGNTEELMQQLNQLESNYSDIIATEKGLEHLQESIVRYVSKIEEHSGVLSTLEHQLGLLGDIYMTMKGDNPLKLSFERYILIDYLEQILVMANIRLHQLSNGQFELQRSERLETHGKQSGLGLDVYDAYTGQNRDVKTLSGGEKFNAALCLALGMTDVIQSHQGGVAIEMMFIDEGFGSLDEESLQKAIGALVELQKAGRMIGVISHVQELKSALPACLEVSKTRDGHSQTSFVVS